ncbi:hypothetical protein B7463_g10763, partial [Scytalidium lignicola]
MALKRNPSRVYTALSYVWGDASITEDILVDGIPFTVTSNLASALQQIQRSFGDIVLWADAITINQRDIMERNQQVLLMKDIYSKAERVIAWLGPDEHGGSQALKTFENIFRNVISYPNHFEWITKMPELLTVNGTYTMNSDKRIQSNDRLEKLMLLLKRPFWKRIWIVQELVLPSNLRLLCGEKFTDMPEPDAFYSAVTMLSKMPSGRPGSLPFHLLWRLIECIAPLRLLATLRFQHLHQKQPVNGVSEGRSEFLHMRPLLDFHEASDPRDHVYGLLGLINLDIVPDYGENMTVADVFVEVARHCLKAHPLDSLCFAGIEHSRNGPDSLIRPDSPSWVPDWRLPTPARLRIWRYPQSHAFPSNDGLQMRVIDRKWIRGPAVVWDRVSRTEDKTGWDLKEWDLVEMIDIEKPGDLAYPSGISRFDAIVILWVGGYDGTKPSACDLQLDSQLFQSYKYIVFANILQPWANKHGRHEIPKLSRLILGRDELTSLPVVPTSHRESYIARSRQLRFGMRCFHTEKGYIGLGPLATEVGDLIGVLEGHKAPVLLRRQGSHYIFVGDCDVVGIMRGEVLEAVQRGEAEIAEIEIR